MPIDNEQQALAAIETWRADPLRAQLRCIQEALASLEMNVMYYDQKGNELGAARTSRCINLLTTRQKEVAAAMQG
jgi:hypothetical protein